MTNDITSREQRLRKQAQLQSLYTNLAHLREREANYINDAVAIPDLFLNQINEARQEIVSIEEQILALGNDSAKTIVDPSAQEAYQQGYTAEVAGNTAQALKLYRSAARYGHSDANAARRSLRYRTKQAKNTATPMWLPTTTRAAGRQNRGRLLIALMLIAIVALLIWQLLSPKPESGLTVNSMPAEVLISTPTQLKAPIPTPTVVFTPTPLPLPTNTPLPPTPKPIITDTSLPQPSDTPTSAPTLRAAPQIIGPKDGLVWGDGTIVFEFEDDKLAYNELYCLNTLRGYDLANNENWSYASVGRKLPHVPIDANTFHVAKYQGINCVVWSAFIAKDSCENSISQSTEERTIGLPRPCDFNK